jgi:hypothetical protein
MKKATTKTASTKGKSSVAKNATTKPKSRSKTKKTSKKSDKDIIQIHVWDIKLTKDSKKRLRKVKNTLWGNAANAIEWGNWYIPVKNYLYTHIKKTLEDGMRDFFSIDKDIPIEIEDFMTNIIEYDNHR